MSSSLHNETDYLQQGGFQTREEEEEEAEAEEEDDDDDDDDEEEKQNPKEWKNESKGGKMKTSVWLISHLSWHDRSVRFGQLDERWEVKLTLLNSHLANGTQKDDKVWPDASNLLATNFR